MKRQSDEWSKVLLGAYNYLPAAVDAAKEEAQKLALSGYSYNGDITKLIDEVMQCNKRIENYINAYVLVKESLRRIGSEKADFLLAVYGDRVPAVRMADRLGISRRTAFRKCAEALTSFERACGRQGYAREWFEMRFGQDLLFCKIADRLRSNPGYADGVPCAVSEELISRQYVAADDPCVRRRGAYAVVPR